MAGLLSGKNHETTTGGAAESVLSGNRKDRFHWALDRLRQTEQAFNIRRAEPQLTNVRSDKIGWWRSCVENVCRFRRFRHSLGASGIGMALRRHTRKSG